MSVLFSSWPPDDLPHHCVLALPINTLALPFLSSQGNPDLLHLLDHTFTYNVSGDKSDVNAAQVTRQRDLELILQHLAEKVEHEQQAFKKLL